MELIAHRGWSAKYPENTLVAFEKAFEAGASWIELDVTLSQDQVPVVIHDDTVDRTTQGSGAVVSFTEAQLEKLGVPSLKSVLKLTEKFPKARVNIELKSTMVQPQQENFERSVWELSRALVPASDRLVFSSFSMLALERLTSFGETENAFLTHHWIDPKKILTFRAANLCAIHIFHECLTKEKVALIHKENLRVRSYTVNDVVTAKKLQDWGVDGIFCDDYPELCRLLKS